MGVAVEEEYVVQVRAGDGGLVLQQLYYADEGAAAARRFDIPLVEVGDTEMQLALQLIEQVSEPAYDPTRYVDEEKQRILAAVEARRSPAARSSPRQRRPGPSGQVIDLVEALRASLRSSAKPAAAPARKPARRAAKAAAAPRAGGRARR